MERVPTKVTICSLYKRQFLAKRTPIIHRYLCLDLGAMAFPEVAPFLRLECGIRKIPSFAYKNGSSPITVIPYDLNIEEMALHVWETFKWRLRSVARPPWSLPENYRDLCSDFILADVEEAAHDFHIPELVQALFYAMVVNEALQLGILIRSMVEDLKAALQARDTWLQLNKSDILITRKLGPAAPGVGPRSTSSEEEGTGSNDASPPSNSHGTQKDSPRAAIYEPGTPSWSNSEYSSIPGILSIEEEVVYPWKVDITVSRMSDVQQRKLARTKTTVQLKTVPELMAEGYSVGNSHST
ncbi:hypothetical protein Cgig2_026389 [Carnegiea gigantea]|uniref:Uncharacterized protein n=1 Tax=Carnegiea gigantea TaxID=171969 RepID=A0A9Q1QAT5_9CARY|nr:hypothetical protein Cgig2_026389 [Carnegiea gigantea]